MPLLPPTMTSTPSINTSSDRMVDRHERSRLGRTDPKVVEGTALAALWKPDLHPCAQRASPEPFYAPQDLDLFARFDSGAHHPHTRHPRQKPTRGPGATGKRHTSPCGDRPALLFPAGYLLRLHGDLYVAVLHAFSLLFKKPIVPGVVIMGWEAFAPIFPAWAQRLSVTFYLKHLCPVSLPVTGPLAIFTIVAEPVSPFVAVLGLVCLTIAILAISCFLIHRMEITYTAE